MRGGGHGRAVKYPGMKIPALREKKTERGEADLLRCAPRTGMAEDRSCKKA